jgi:hypothetical protein
MNQHRVVWVHAAELAARSDSWTTDEVSTQAALPPGDAWFWRD